MTPEGWGRWGSQDERGAANLLTPDHILAALRLPTRGHVYSLAMPIQRDTMPLVANRPPPMHFMTSDGGDYAARGKVHGTMIADDFLAFNPSCCTHVDALAHVWQDGTMYNAFAGSEVRSDGALRLGIEKAGAFITRGIMLDIAAAHGTECLPERYAIGSAELAQCADRQGVALRSGDAVFVRTGWQSAYAPGTAWELREPGITLDAAYFLVERDVFAVGSDNAGIEVQPSAEGRGIPVHVELLRNRGIYLFELCQLDELSRDHIFEFLFIAAPLPIAGGVAGPVTPLAVT